MAGAVRELITKVKFVIDNSSLSKVNSEIRRLKKTLAGIDTKEKNIRFKTTGLETATRGILRAKSELKALNGQVATVRVRALVDPLKKSTVMGTVANQARMGAAGAKSSRMQSISDNAGTIAASGVAMVAPLASTINTAMDFEEAMSKVKAITNSTDDDMARLTQTARDLGASTKYSATEAAQAMSYLGMAGWKTEQIIAGMPGLLDLAAASGEDLARVADIVSDDLTAFKMPAEQAGHMADVMAAASSNANTNVSMMGETFKYAGAIAGSLGYSLEDVAAAAGLMANAGIKSEMAGTALRSIMTRMIKPPKDAAEALDQLGISATNADGTVKPFREQMIALRNAMKNLSDSEKAEMGASIAGQEAMSGFLAVINASDSDFAKMTNAVDNADGAAAKMAKTMNNNAKGALRSLKSAIEDVSIEIGDIFLESLRGAVVGLTDFVRGVGEFAKAHPNIVAGVVGIVAAIGTLMIALGGVGLAVGAIGAAITALAPLLASVSGALAPVLAAISGALSIGFAPLLAIILAIAAAIYTVKEYWDVVVALFKPGLDAMQEGLESLRKAWENIQPFIAALIPLIKILAALIGGAIVAAVMVMWNIFTAAFNAIAKLIEWVSSLLGGLGSIIQTIGAGLGGIIDKAREFIGIKGQIDGVNMSSVQRMWDRGTGQNSVNQSQSNVYNLPSMSALPAAQSASNSFFVSDFG